ncbi:hypothetical protein MEO93_27390, partial [Dolichospermum sp. ST_sed3]|nr:hypothetical protein [Dolichospermum sp. ST_sed3]
KERTSSRKFKPAPVYVDRRNAWQCGLSITMFLRKEVISEIGGFDESLGLGASTRWQSGEDTDYILRAIKADFNLYYLPTLVISHEDAVPNYTLEMDKGRSYGEGMGRVLQKHNYPIWEVFGHLLYPFGVIFKASLKNDHAKARYFWAVAVGRLGGLRAKKLN